MSGHRAGREDWFPGSSVNAALGCRERLERANVADEDVLQRLLEVGHHHLVGDGGGDGA